LKHRAISVFHRIRVIDPIIRFLRNDTYMRVNLWPE